MALWIGIVAYLIVVQVNMVEQVDEQQDSCNLQSRMFKLYLIVKQMGVDEKCLHSLTQKDTNVCLSSFVIEQVLLFNDWEWLNNL